MKLLSNDENIKEHVNFDDNGKILEKTIEFKVPVSEELATDFGKWLEEHKDQKYKVRLEDYKDLP